MNTTEIRSRGASLPAQPAGPDGALLGNTPDTFYPGCSDSATDAYNADSVVLGETVLDFAIRHRESGLCTIPIKQDGTKAPDGAVLPGGKWKDYQRKMPELVDLDRWFKDGDHGIGITCGEVSGNLEVMDFDCDGIYDEWYSLLREVHPELAELVSAMPLVQTPRDGRCFHLYFRVDGEVGGNTVLACHVIDAGNGGRKERKVSIETRGSGGYVVAPGSPASVHPTGRPYRLVRGDLAKIPAFTTEQRDSLYEIARAFNEWVTEANSGGQPISEDISDLPGTQYNNSPEWRDLVVGEGWREVTKCGSVEYWCRPGKSQGVSATFNYMGNSTFYVFSTNACPLEPNTSYTPFGLFAMFRHKGDFSAAAKDLKKRQFGENSRKASLECADSRVLDLAGDDEKPQMNSVEPAPPLSVWTWQALLNREVSPPEFICDGLIPRRGVTLLTGEGGVGKSFMSLDLAYSVATGGKFLQFFDCVQGAVLMVDLENDEATIARRVQKITTGRRESGDTAEEIPVYVVKKGDLANAALLIDDRNGAAALRSAIESYVPLLLIIDPLVAIHNGDENDNLAMRQLVMTLQNIARSYNLAVVLIHHPRKRGMVNDPGQMIRGASDLRNAVDSHFFVRKVSKEQAIVEHDKSRHAYPVPKFTIEMKDNEAGTSTCIRHLGATTESIEKRAAAREILLSIFQQIGECKRSGLLDRAMAEGVSRSTSERALKDLLSEGSVVQQMNKGPYMLREHPCEMDS